MAIDRETLMYRNAWRKAFTEGEVLLRLQSSSDLTNIRFKLYNVAKQVKRMEPGTDFELEDAVSNCSITIDKKALTLKIYRKDKSLLLQSIAAQLGESIGDMVSPALIPPSAELGSSFERMLQAQAQADETKRVDRPFPYPVRKNPEEGV